MGMAQSLDFESPGGDRDFCYRTEKIMAPDLLPKRLACHLSTREKEGAQAHLLIDPRDHT